MICKEFHWNGENNIRHTSQLCVPSPPKSIHLGNSFKPIMFDFKGSDGTYELRVRLLKFEFMAYKRWYDFNTDEFISFWRAYWKGDRLFGPKDIRIGGANG